MRIRAWVSDNGATVELHEHEGWRGLSAWWRGLPKIVGVMVLFSDGSRHRMEASEFYAVMRHGIGRRRFWNGDMAELAPAGADVVQGTLVPEDLYLTASDEMELSH